MIDWTATVSIISLAVAGSLCVAGVFCHAYKDNWLQFAGLWGMAGWAFSRIEVIAERGYTEPWNLALHLGMAAYGVGTALKVLHHSRPGSCDTSDEDLPEIGREAWPHVGGGAEKE